ncbi:MAG: hypothetical protein JW825_02200 [Candidatus Methanofastidiosa archaeon]|nr:hypothetical protein [Candidatus Methanofastidiosa archaeon]
MDAEDALSKEIYAHIRDSGRGLVPLPELILKFRSSPYGYDKGDIISSAEGMVGTLLKKEYMPVKCRLIPFYGVLTGDKG